MTEQERNLSDHYREAIIALNVEINRYEQREHFTLIVGSLRQARDVLFQLYGDWLTRVKTPSDITPTVKAQWLRELANQIEEDITS